jgi:hypothetical protein
MHQGLDARVKGSRGIKPKSVIIFENALEQLQAEGQGDRPVKEAHAYFDNMLKQQPRIAVWPRLDRGLRACGNLGTGLRYQPSKLSTATSVREGRPVWIVSCIADRALQPI